MTDGLLSLTDIDECKDNLDICGTNAQCRNKVGSYNCECHQGYSNYGNNQSKCIEMSCDQFKAESDVESTPETLKHLRALLRSSCESLRTANGSRKTGEQLLELPEVASWAGQPSPVERSHSARTDSALLQHQAVGNSCREINPRPRFPLMDLQHSQSVSGGITEYPSSIVVVIVIISAISFPAGYGTKRHCWLSLDQNFIWSFLAPVCIIVVLNSFVFTITVWKLAEKFSSLNPDLSKLRNIKGFTVTAVAQFCILGGTWVFGSFLFYEKVTQVALYLFTILNSLQGVIIFIMHCLLSKPVRDEYYKLISRICSLKEKKYSEFSTNHSSNSQQPLRSNPTTGESKI
ncbi:hypothetical protein cypCar_00018230 [Cyprinus carpio]|nr:hypothetical protein cypCar_00018230 [Cyprinus carpio]